MSRAPAASVLSTPRRRCAPRKRTSPMAGSGRSPRRSSVERVGRIARFGATALAVMSTAAAIGAPDFVGSGLAGSGHADSGLRPYAVVGDAIPEPLSEAAGDPVRGRAIVVNRQAGLCLLCHTGPFPEERFQGN